jgi:hypothetical protein
MSYYYQRKLTRADLMQALGIGVVAGAAVAAVVAYVARIFIQRTPVRPESQPVPGAPTMPARTHEAT